MSESGVPQVNRRDFIQTGAAAAASVAAVSGATASAFAQEPDGKKPVVLPKRPLGKLGVDVTILNQGTWRAPDSIDRLLRLGHAGGIRYIDTAKSYGSEPAVAKFLSSLPAGERKEIFLVTKDVPRSPKQLIEQLDQRLAQLKVDYVDLFFHHAMGDHGEPVDLVKSKEMKEVVEAIKKSGKAKFVGFSCHNPKKAEFLQAAADGGFIDAIMVAYNPFLPKSDPLQKSIDACVKAGIGLISMKQFSGNENEAKLTKEVEKRLPDFKEKGINPFQALLHALWTDERFSTACVSMRNTDHLREDIKAARDYQPLKAAQLELLHEAVLAAGPTFCANCDGRCARAAGTDAPLGDIARMVTYHDHYGFRGEARELFAKLPAEARDWANADLAAAREACHNKLDFADLLARAEKHLA